jgi:hypothetical protein
MRKLNLFGMLALILAFGMIFAGCSSEESDIWSPVTSINQLNGNWKSSYYKTMTYKEWYTKWNQPWGAQQEALYGNMILKRGFDQIRTINAGSRTMSETGVNKSVYSGGKISTAWDLIKTWNWGSSPTFNDNEHSVTTPFSSASRSFDWNLSYIQINQNGKKIKYNTTIDDDPVSDYILTKQ